MKTEMRYSRQREAILLNLRSRCDHPDADEVYTSVREVYPNISLGTVYRNLRQLNECGEIICFSDGKRERFDGDTRLHYHFICTACNTVFDIFSDEVSQFLLNAQGKLDCEIDRATMVLNGRSRSCCEK